jgi:hypothetical protein
METEGSHVGASPLKVSSSEESVSISPDSRDITKKKLDVDYFPAHMTFDNI